MKRTTKKLTKRQRKVRSARKTWTRAEEFQLRNERTMRETGRLMKQIAKLEKQFREQAAMEKMTSENTQETIPEAVSESVEVISPKLPE